MDTEKLIRVLPLVFKTTKTPERGKEELRARLFDKTVICDDELEFVVAAGDALEAENRKYMSGDDGGNHEK